MSSVYDTLVERGFIEQCTHEKELRELLEKEKVTSRRRHDDDWGPFHAYRYASDDDY